MGTPGRGRGWKPDSLLIPAPTRYYNTGIHPKWEMGEINCLFNSRVCACRQSVRVTFLWTFTFQYFVFILSGFNHAVRLLSWSLKDLANNLDFKLVLLFLIL